MRQVPTSAAEAQESTILETAESVTKTPTPKPEGVRLFQLSGGARSFILPSGRQLIASPFDGHDVIYATTAEEVAALCEAVDIGNAAEV